jgi:predicted PurR-regulated permease PerM
MPNDNKKSGLTVSHVTSLIVLAALVGIIGLMSFQVLSVFLLPLFLAGMLAVLFRPLHHWLTRKCRNRPNVAAVLTTLVILLLVLVPTVVTGLLAASEAAAISESIDRDTLTRGVAALRTRLSVGPPPVEVMRALERLRRTLDQIAELPVGPRADAPAELQRLNAQLLADTDTIETGLGLKAKPAVAPVVLPEGTPPAPAAVDATPTAPVTATPTGTAKAAAPLMPHAAADQLVAAWAKWKETLAEPKPAIDDVDSWFSSWDEARRSLAQFRTELLGGPIAAWFKQNIDIEPDQLQGAVDRIRSAAGPLALGTTQFVASFAVNFTLGLIIMLMAVYYFLVDGKAMIASVMRLTPLDNSYLHQLVEEFANLTRAVVLSMLLAAVAQGVLAALGYWAVGLQSVFLLMLLTIICSVFPVVGSAIVWVSCCLWLWLHDGRTVAAIGLAIYCGVVVAAADNVVKPMVLHGKSNLHPLAALLSVIGGAAVLGPIGLFVGPMVVALLHTLLVMLRKELTTLEKA